ncbi:DUF551 domain-containing protein [Salmonella enterica subsp. enterica]|nr:DUF551 domain-containing protein [Salmonella enterica subsp. enterica]
MTTITREQQKQILIDTANHVISRDNTSPYSENLRELARISLASLEAEPIGAFHIADQQVGGTSDYIKDGEWPIDNGVIEVYAAPPAPVVPDEWAIQDAVKFCRETGRQDAGSAMEAWNACHAALLNGDIFRENSISSTNNFREIAETSTNSPVIPGSWISCSERMPNDKQYVWCWGKSYGWTEYDTFEWYYDWSRNKWWAVTDDGEEPASKVTHWMPLPEPPQEVKGE